MGGPSIRSARPGDLSVLPALEAASDTLLDGMLPTGRRELPPPATVPELAASRHILVAGDPPAGFARLEETDGQVHLEQLSVHPDAAGAGLGRALVEAALDWARQHGYTSMTLCTFADVPFNAPFYASCGFEVVQDPDGELAAVRQHEIRLGLDSLGKRVAMRARL
ncbi:GNAT family N-acetyltransferase [Arthrobacter sp. zg-Y859]|uniref:GNAT family N-acetyltransferase n=1 Tax=Arthrobacter jinronghuae TaxID=2964609 RepID=A0ABT1NS45_9MICC|nr:GNAT family N-acetyltransferase [Arthrobacter jinronghuae]MCQ1950557.1 GNAT family N-acetyltransferase [Arthrobacter jinronghuae]UWX77524.1 GNAT family N-acetyltransferase [Arthrobacter jinronghuae]